MRWVSTFGTRVIMSDLLNINVHDGQPACGVFSGELSARFREGDHWSWIIDLAEDTFNDVIIILQVIQW